MVTLIVFCTTHRITDYLKNRMDAQSLQDDSGDVSHEGSHAGLAVSVLYYFQTFIYNSMKLVRLGEKVS